MAPCGSCGGKKPGAGVEFEIRYRGGEPTERVATRSEVRRKLSDSSAGGTFRLVAKR